MKRLLAVTVAAVVAFSFAKAVPVPIPKNTDPYDDDLLRVKKPMLDVRRGEIADRRQAADRLIKLASEIQQLVIALDLGLESPDEVVRMKSAKALQQIGPSAHLAIPNLVKALQDSSEDVRAEAANALRAIGPSVAYAGTTNKYLNVEQIVPALVRRLKDESKKVRLAAVWALGFQGPFAKPGVPALVKAMREDDTKDEKVVNSGGSMRVRAILALCFIGPEAKEAIPALLEVVQKGETPYVRECAIRALGQIALEDAKVLRVLLAAAKEKDVRLPAVDALGRVGPRHADKVIPVLVKALDVSDIENKISADYIQRAAIRGLMQLGPDTKVALPKIEEILKDPKTGAGTRIEAERAVKQMRR